MPASPGPTSSCTAACGEDLPSGPEASPERPQQHPDSPDGTCPPGLEVSPSLFTVPAFPDRATYHPKSASWQVFEGIGDSACAFAEDLGTVDDMRGRGLTAKTRSDIRTRRIRGLQPPVPRGAVAAPAAVGLEDLAAVAADVANRLGAAQPTTTMRSAGTPLAEVIALPRRLPELVYDPFTRALDGSGRLRVRIDSQSLTELLGWESGPLTAITDGLWTVLRPDTDGGPLVRNDGRCSVTDDGRLRLSDAVTYALAARPGSEVAVLVLPDQNAVAVCRPAALLLGAPLELLSPPTCTCSERTHSHG